jgi:exo-beta-1,3-glucanase (GH17 family)
MSPDGFMGGWVLSENFVAPGAGNLGVNYGLLANNLPAPTQVAQLLLTTSLRYVKLYSADQATLQALANTSIKVAVGVTNDEISLLAGSVTSAQAWVQTNIVAYMPATQFNYIIVGDEVLTVSPELTAVLVPAMSNLYTALVNLELDSELKVSTPHNLGLLGKSFPPSVGAFNSSLSTTMQALLAFLSRTNSPFMVNAYPYFAYSANPVNVSLDYALLQQQPNAAAVTDINTGLHYTNLLDAQLDAVYSAMERLGYGDISLAVSETGWPSNGDPDEVGCGITNAATYNGNLIKLVSSNAGTPLRPGSSFDVFIFALFNEDMKPGPSSERNFGLFNVDETPVYNVGLVQTSPSSSSSPPSPAASSPTASSPPPTPAISTPAAPAPAAPTVPAVYPPPLPPPSPPSAPATTPPASPSGPVAAPAPPTQQPIGKTWCVAKPGAAMQDLTNALNYACGEGGANCVPIQSGNPCYQPNTLNSHASYAFNSYYQLNGRNYWNCYFGNTGVITITDPSKSSCSCSPSTSSCSSSILTVTLWMVVNCSVFMVHTLLH